MHYALILISFLPLCLCITTNPQQFLQAPSSSAGMLGQGIEDVGAQLEVISQELSEAFQGLDYQLDSSVGVTAQSAIILIDSQIQTKQNELLQLQDELAELKSEQNLETMKCDEFVTCQECTLNSSCIWCSSSDRCIAGDDTGPFVEECGRYEFGVCPMRDCSDIVGCQECLSLEKCGWCELGKYCLEGNPEDTGDCDPMFFLSQLSPGKDVCPYETQTSLTSTPQNTLDMVKIAITARISNKIRQLTKEIQQLGGQITQLTNDREQLTNNMQQISQSSPSPITGGEAPEDISIQIDNKVQEENQKRDSTIQAELEEMAINVTTSVNETAERGIDAILTGQQSNTQRVMGRIDTLDAAIQQEIQSMQQRISTEISNSEARTLAATQDNQFGDQIVSNLQIPSLLDEAVRQGQIRAQNGARGVAPEPQRGSSEINAPTYALTEQEVDAQEEAQEEALEQLEEVQEEMRPIPSDSLQESDTEIQEMEAEYQELEVEIQIYQMELQQLESEQTDPLTDAIEAQEQRVDFLEDQDELLAEIADLRTEQEELQQEMEEVRMQNTESPDEQEEGSSDRQEQPDSDETDQLTFEDSDEN